MSTPSERARVLEPGDARAPRLAVEAADAVTLSVVVPAEE